MSANSALYTMHCPSLSHLSGKLCVALMLASSAPAWAGLGGFENLDGYHVSANGSILSNQDLVTAGEMTIGGALPTAEYYYQDIVTLAPDIRFGPDLSRYNAGQYSGLGGAIDIADNSGLWTSVYGGRLVEDSLGGPWDGWGTDYASASTLKAHTGTQSLALRATDDSVIYGYTLDSSDTPVNSGRLALSFWATPSALDNTYTGNVFGLAFQDHLGNSLFEVGYTGDNLLQYRLGGQLAWTTTTAMLGDTGWSQLSLVLDTNLDTASLSFLGFDDALGTLTGTQNLLGNLSLGMDATDLSALSFTLQGGYLDAASLNDTHYIDDFSVAAVPEPSSACLAAIGLLWRVRRRRR